ncbi:MAG: lysoplasmalogenase [Polyangiaceae bacterium]
MWLFGLVMALLVALLLWSSRAGHAKAEWLFKPAASATFVIAGLTRPGIESAFSIALVVGLFLAAAGDILLIPKHAGSFLAGLVAFLLGHAAYAVAFATIGIELRATLFTAVALVVVAIVVLRWLLPHVEAPMRAPVLAYVVVISAMVALSVGAALRASAPWLVVGAVMFYLSDLSVARERFVRSGFVNRAWGLPLYFAAQLVLAAQVGGR